LDRQLPREHRVRSIRQLVDEWDLTELYDVYAGVGSEAYPPDLLLKVVLLEMLEGRPSPAQWFRDLHDSLPLRWLAMGITPSRTALYDFRDRAGKVIQSLNAQLIRRAHSQGFIDGQVEVQDGTAIRACASRHRLVNAETLARRITALQEAVLQDKSGMPVERPGWMARTPGGRLAQADRYGRAQEILIERLARNAKRRKDKRLSENKVMVSLSDPEAALGRDKEKVFGPCYTAQFVVDRGSLLIVASHVAAQATDAGMLPVMLDQRCEVLGGPPRKQVADAGYVSILDLQECAKRGVELIAPFQENDFTARKRAQKPKTMLGKEAFTWLPHEQTYACPQGHRLKHLNRQRLTRREETTLLQTQYRCPPEHCQTCPIHLQCCRNPQTGRTIKRIDGEELLDEHRQRMATPEALELRRLRGSIIERTFADAKRHRGLHRLHGRGLRRAQTEVHLVVLAINLLRLIKLRKTAHNSNADDS
jgi:transposase